MINKELTHAKILEAKNELLKAHAEIFKKARDLEAAVGALGTLPITRDQNIGDIEFVKKRFEECGLESCLVMD